MTETKLLSKYQEYLASIPDVEVISVEEKEKGIASGRQRYEIEFIVVKGVPQTERAQTKRTWEAIMEVGGKIPPEAVAYGLNKGIYEVPVMRYRLNDEQHFTELCQNIIFDSKQSDRVLAAYYVENKEDLVPLLEGAFGSISMLEDLKKLPSASDAADQFVRNLPVQVNHSLEVKEEVSEDENGEKVIKFTAIFMEDDDEPTPVGEIEGAKEELDAQEAIKEAERITSSPASVPSGNLDDAILNFLNPNKDK